MRKSNQLIPILAIFLFSTIAFNTSSNAQAWKANLNLDWVNEYLKTDPSVGIAFHYGKAEYLGLMDPDGMNAMGGMDFETANFEALADVILKGRKSDALTNAKVLESEFYSGIKKSQRDALIYFMKENQLDLLQIVDFKSIFTGMRQGSATSGSLIGFRYSLFVESSFYFLPLLEDKSLELSATRSSLNFLAMIQGDGSVTHEVTLTEMANDPYAKSNIPGLLTVKAAKSQEFLKGFNLYGSIGMKKEKPAYDAIIIGMEGGYVKINKKKQPLQALAIGSKNYSVMDAVSGDNPATFWKESGYDIVVATIKVTNATDQHSVCEIKSISEGYDPIRLEGLPVFSSGNAQYGINGMTPPIAGINLVGKRYTIEEFEKSKMAEEGVAAIDEDYYLSKAVLHPKTELSSSAKPNIVPKKEKRLLAKIRRYESEGNKIAVVFSPGFVKLENPAESSTPSTRADPPAPTTPSANTAARSYSLGNSTSSGPPPCKFEPGSSPLTDNFLNTGVYITKALNDGFGTKIFEYVDEAVLPKKERKVLGQVVQSADLFNTQYKTAIVITLAGNYEVDTGAIPASSSMTTGKLSAKLNISSSIQVVEYNNGSNKAKVITTAVANIPPVMKSVDECMVSIDDFTSALGSIEGSFVGYEKALNKMLEKLISRQSK